MVTRSRVRDAGTALLSVGILVTASAAWGNPVLTSPAADEPAISVQREQKIQSEQRIPESRAAVIHPPLPVMAVEPVVPVDEAALLRNFTPPPTRPGSQSPRRSAAGAEIDLQLKQILRQLNQLFGDPAGAAIGSQRRNGWDGAQDAGRGDIYFFGFGSTMTRDPLASAPQLGPANFPSGGHEEFTFSPSGARRSHNSDLPQPVYGESYSASAQRDYTSARASVASAQWAPLPQGAGAAEHLTPFMDSFRDVLTDPVTLMVAFGWLMLWLFLETVQWGPSRRRRRQ
jgi:hypothetical protein